ncbi:hypothetical protein [Singulisphaera sp. PoT]|uniref:hypothetical protein n=1 Tax=Singulisphaera sp. PoT TaxID=3411797 RepID=UPI003BF56025
MELRADAPRASTSWTIPEIRIVKDDQGRLRIDQDDPATYGAHAARQLLATAEADPRYRDGMTKRPSTTSIKITYVNELGETQKVGVREVFCRMDGDALVVTQFENAEGEKVKDLPIATATANATATPPLDDMGLDDDLEGDVDYADRFHELALAELSDEPPPPAEVEPEPEPVRAEPQRERRMPTGPLRKYEDKAPAAEPSMASSSASSQSASSASAATQPESKPTSTTLGTQTNLTVKALNEAEAAALRAMIEAKTGQARWANGLLMQAAERYPSDRKQQNEHLANLMRVSLEPLRAESRTPLAAALRSILEEVLAFKAGVLDRDPLKAEKLTLSAYARTVLATTPVEETPVKTVSGASQKTPAQVLAKLEDPKLARATRVKLLLEIVPSMIEAWRPDKESTRSEAGNENSPAIVRKLFAVANEQRQQRKYIDNGVAFKKAGERYSGLEGRLPKASPTDD